MASSDLQDLLQEAEQMTAQIDKENVGLPRLQRTLSQLFEINKRKLAKTSNFLSSDTNEINASILLAAKGIDAPKLTQTIENLNLSTAANLSALLESYDAAPETFIPITKLINLDYLKEADLKSFLKSEKENALMSVIEETKCQIIQEIDESLLTSCEIEWENQKQKIMQELLGSFNPEMSIMSTIPAINPRMSSNISNKRDMSVMNDIEIEFSKEINSYNQKLIAKEHPKPDLLLKFFNLSQRLNDKNIEDMWKMLFYMSNLESNKNDYENETINRADLLETQKQKVIQRDSSAKTQINLVNQAISYLENCFKEVLQNTVSSNLKQAKIGGTPGTLSLVSGYLRLSQSEKYYQNCEETFDDRQPLWPTIFLCLRCGDIEAARSIAAKTRKDDLVTYFDEWLRDSNELNARRHLSITRENNLKAEYKSKIKRANDLYKRAVYSYLCRISDDDAINKILDNLDDFLWFKLNSVVFGSNKDSNTSENVTFTDFQSKLSIDYGEKYFVKNRNPFPYLQVLILTGQFELAIEFLLNYESMIVHGVHMGIALFERKLLNINKSFSSSQLFISGDPSLNEPKCLRRINFPNLIKMYTRKFESTDPQEALNYYYFLRNFPSSVQSKFTDYERQIFSYFDQFTCELVLETREFELFFGKLEKNDIRRFGLVDKFVDENETHLIISLVGEELENKGLIEEAIKLFDLSKKHQNVLNLCNKKMSQLVTELNTPNSARDRLKSMVFSIALRYKSETNLKAVQKSALTTFYLLTDLMTFFDLYHSENWETAYETLNKLAVLPKTSLNVESCIKEFVSLSDEIKRNFPDLILAAMTIYSNLYASIGSINITNPFQSIDSQLLNEKRKQMEQLKEQAKALIKFVSCIPYRLSGNISARLLQLEVTMN